MIAWIAAVALAAAIGFVGALFVGGVTTPNVGKQVDAAFSAPIPFALALFAVLVPTGLLIWRAMEWAYGRVIDAKQALIDQKDDYANGLQRELDEVRENFEAVQSKAKADLQKNPNNELARFTSEKLDIAEGYLATAGKFANAITGTISDKIDLRTHPGQSGAPIIRPAPRPRAPP